MSSFRAVYEFADQGGHYGGTVMLPVVGWSEPDEKGRRHAQVLVCIGDVDAVVAYDFDGSIDVTGGRLETVCLEAVADPIPAESGWIAEIWTRGSRRHERPSQHVGDFHVLAWEPELVGDYEDNPGGHAVVLIATPSAYLPDPGPISTRLLPGMTRFRRRGDEPFGPLYDDDHLDADDLAAADSRGVLDYPS